LALIREVGLEAKDRLITKPKGDADREPIREAIRNLTADNAMELTPAEGDSMRGLKRSVTRAANEVNRTIKYGETPEGTLLVWQATPRRRTRRSQA
jgi:hypothetical protein